MCRKPTSIVVSTIGMTGIGLAHMPIAITCPEPVKTRALMRHTSPKDRPALLERTPSTRPKATVLAATGRARQAPRRKPRHVKATAGRSRGRSPPCAFGSANEGRHRLLESRERHRSEGKQPVVEG